MSTVCKKILVVEDDLDIRTQIVQILIDEGYKALSATNGKEALDLLSDLSEDDLPGCIILDLMMPIMTGRQFLDKVMVDSKLSSIPIVVATAKGSPKEELIGLPSHVGRIRKPMGVDELIAAIEVHCGKPE